MLGHGWPECEPDAGGGVPGRGAPWAVDVVVWVVVVVVALPELGAAAAPAIPAIAPAPASAVITDAVINAFGRFTSSNLLRSVVMVDMLGGRCKENARPG